MQGELNCADELSANKLSVLVVVLITIPVVHVRLMIESMKLKMKMKNDSFWLSCMNYKYNRVV